MSRPDEQYGHSKKPAHDEATQALQPPDAQATRVVELLDQYLAQLKAGEKPDRQQLLAEHPELASQLEACLAGIEFIHGGNAGGQPAGKRLGEFRIIREIGHGGMGAVYEAEQISLGRRVALKVLRFGPVSDEEAITRFQREAETIARLHHTNIVPIFAVGSEGGVNYYAMQYIVGRSLDQVLRESGKPIPARTVAEWGLQAAEALAHAHARGVIHRDVKPSNLLIDDDEGRIWLTDFGLAKRLDDVTLSMTGALLGTPRYMSPEQAMAAHAKLDHRTDLYSLGATLYELATNQPVFTGDTPHDVISKIIGREVDPPRKHVPTLPRDLNTILMKCLAKEPARRYASARDLADDLRAFLDGRVISARRASILEQGVRWVKKQQRSLVLTTAAVAATLLMVASSVAASYFWQRSRLAFVRLETDRPPIVAQLLTASGEEAMARTTLPMQLAEEVPAGEYRLRVSSEQRFSQDYAIGLSPGQHVVQKLDVEDQVLWSDFKYPRTFAPVVIASTRPASDLPKTDLLLLNHDAIQGCDGMSREALWSLNLEKPTHELLTKGVNLRWPWDNTSSVSLHGVGAFDDRPHVVSAANFADAGSFDLNADGATDLVIAARHQAWLLAVSGSDGSPLWVVARGDAILPEDGQKFDPYGIGSAVPYAPLVVNDQDDDGIADLATWFTTTLADGGISRELDLISGKTGAVIWKYDAPAELFALPATMTEPPQDFRWHHGSGGGYGGGGSGGGANGKFTRRYRWNLERNSGQVSYLPSAPAMVQGGAAGPMAFLAGTHIVKLDVKMGKSLAEPLDAKVHSTLAPRWSDLDGDGATDVLLTTQLPDQPGVPPQLQVTAWSLGKQTTLWQATLAALPPVQQRTNVEAPTWPLVDDLEGDGAAEVIVPEKSNVYGSDWEPPWGTLAVLEGASGKVRWRRQLRNVDQQLDTFTVGPDVNGDGRRDVFVASLWNEDYELYLDCFSGANGDSLWRAHHPTRVGFRTSEAHRLAPLTWYGGGDGNLPRLVVRLDSDTSLLPNLIGLYSAASGEQLHLASGASDLKMGDFDGNGIEDLLLIRPVNSQYLDNGGTLHVCRGTGHERRRRLLTDARPMFDFDADGCIDLIQTPFGGRVEARSGASGELLWTTALDDNYVAGTVSGVDTDHRPYDLNHDGMPPNDNQLWQPEGQRSTVPRAQMFRAQSEAQKGYERSLHALMLVRTKLARPATNSASSPPQKQLKLKKPPPPNGASA